MLRWAQDVDLELTFGMVLIQLVGCLLPVLNLVLERGDQTLHQSTVGETGTQHLKIQIHNFTGSLQRLSYTYLKLVVTMWKSKSSTTSCFSLWTYVLKGHYCRCHIDVLEPEQEGA